MSERMERGFGCKDADGGTHTPSPVPTSCTQRFPNSSGVGWGPLQPPPAHLQGQSFALSAGPAFGQSGFYVSCPICKAKHLSLWMNPFFCLPHVFLSQVIQGPLRPPIISLGTDRLAGAEGRLLPIIVTCLVNTSASLGKKNSALSLFFFFLSPSVFRFKHPLSEEKHLLAKGCTAWCRGCAPGTQSKSFGDTWECGEAQAGDSRDPLCPPGHSQTPPGPLVSQAGLI